MSSQSPLYLGFDLSTQQLKGLAVTADLKVEYEAEFDFDNDSRGFHIRNGVIHHESEHEVYAPVALWLQAVDHLLGRLKDRGLDFARVKCISGAGQQHGSVYWNQKGENALTRLDSGKTLELQLHQAFSHPFSPNWQDASTQEECDRFDRELANVSKEDDSGSPQIFVKSDMKWSIEIEGGGKLAHRTGSKAHHRFTGPQILKFRRKYPTAWQETTRVSLVSSFLASVFLGRIAPIDISDACGMNLWDIQAGRWDKKLIALASGPNDVESLERKLGNVHVDGGQSLGRISSYYVKRYAFKPSCFVAPFTGDNPATILALPLQPRDAIVSLGTSTTFLMLTPEYQPDPAVHFFNHPTTPGLYMFMLCYKNGGLAREQVRDAINQEHDSKSWTKFDMIATDSPILGQNECLDTMRIGLYFPLPEIVPNVPAGQWRFRFDKPQPKVHGTLRETGDEWRIPQDDARAIIESQMLSLRLRSQGIFGPSIGEFPPQPRRIYLVGGGSRNAAIAQIVGQVLGGTEGIFKLDVGGNACALGAAYKAVWSAERRNGETFESFIGARWCEEEFVQKVAEGYSSEAFGRYGSAIEGLREIEAVI